MERLTKRKEENGQRWIELRCCADCSECCDCEDIWMALDRLAAYEDTGLSPEQINEMKVSVKICKDCWNEALSTKDELAALHVKGDNNGTD